jgi:hypothetical protein
MKSNLCEDQTFSSDLTQFHELEMKKVGLPLWMKELTCPFCKANMPLRAVRSIAYQFNARNFGDVSVEVFCPECRQMDTLYFRKTANSMDEFIKCLHGKKPESEPVLEEKMYKMQYNNMTERMAQAFDGLKQGDIPCQ